MADEIMRTGRRLRRNPTRRGRGDPGTGDLGGGDPEDHARPVAARAVLAVSVLGLAFAALVADVRSAAAAYPEHSVDVIVPYAAGGGFDLYARAVGRVMERTLGVPVIARNLAGAGGARGVTTMFRAAPDGYTFAILDLPGALQPQLLGEIQHYDLDKVTWLGVVDIATYSLVVGRKSPFQTLAALRSGSPRLPFIATSGSNMLTAAKIAVATLAMQARFLTSYQGGPDTHLAVMRGEADAAMAVDVTVARHIESGELKRLLWLQHDDAPGAPPGVPGADGIGHPELANLSLYRLFAAPPGLTDDVRQTLIAAVQAALHDPELTQWAAATGSPIDPGTPEEALRLYRAQKEFMARHVDILRGP